MKKQLAILATAFAATIMAQTTETILHTFAAVPNGSTPLAGLARDTAGNLYGTTCKGGPSGAGVVFKIDTAGRETVLYGFTGGEDGACPEGGVTLDAAGNLYGTAYQGGQTNAGVVFKLDASGHEMVLFSFGSENSGDFPAAGVVLDSAGNIYGTTQNGGGTANAGVVFKLATTGVETVLHSFTGGSDGGSPAAGVILDAAGNVYGATSRGGTAGAGVVFKIDTTATESVLYSFSGGADGDDPNGGVILDTAGNLYGTTFSGGTAGKGVVFKISAAGQQSVLLSFTGANGGGPRGSLLMDSAGNLYGVTYGSSLGASVIFKLNPALQETVLYTFKASTGGLDPCGSLIEDSAGNFYGTTTDGGQGDSGAVFELTAAGHEKVLYSFSNGAGGEDPLSGLTQDSAGNLYGTAKMGGSHNAGVVYKLNAAGKETVLYSFKGGKDGAGPYAGVTLDAAGNFYGTTSKGGASGQGVVYMVSSAGVETVLYNFTGGADGGMPECALVRDAQGNLYGTAPNGGTSGAGVVFKVNPQGQETVLYAFTGQDDGGVPYGGLIQDSAGNLYGTAWSGGASDHGVVFKIDTAGNESVLYSFAGGLDGANPFAALVQDTAGDFYGTTVQGGASKEGVVFKLDTTGRESVLYAFTGKSDGGEPYAGIVLDASGNVYGTATIGGTGSHGAVFMVNPAGQETVLHDFTGGADGGDPFGGVIRDASGNLYGAAEIGGTQFGGLVFEMTAAN